MFILFSFPPLIDNLGILACICGFWNPIFTAALLLDIFSIFPNLQDILQSVYQPKKNICITLVLFFLLTYFFSLLYYFQFWTDVSPLCNSLWLCYSAFIDLTYKDDGGFVNFFEPEEKYLDEWGDSLWKILYDFAYIFMIIILISQILSGIIIDTFAQLREKREERMKDQRSVCFICG